MPSTRTRRSATGKNAADAITAWRSRSRAIYEKERFRAAMEAIPGPRVLCYDSVTTVSGASTRSPLLLPDGDYGPVIKLVETVAHLLVTSAPVRRRIMISIDLLYAESAEAQEQFDVLHPGENEPTEALVNKGIEEGADMSEMFTSKGLVQVYLDTQSLTPYLPLAAALLGSVGEIGQDSRWASWVHCVLEWADPALFYSDATEHCGVLISCWVGDAQIDHVIEMVHHDHKMLVVIWEGYTSQARWGWYGHYCAYQDEPYRLLIPQTSDTFLGLGCQSPLTPKLSDQTSGDRKF
ncbi:hypothetical protein CPB85DRAFT_1253028 [Mucidula mucida]|nr:hypothetical protein CPB85DRAFT_1253028 [Mucidula mucida]